MDLLGSKTALLVAAGVASQVLPVGRFVSKIPLKTVHVGEAFVRLKTYCVSWCGDCTRHRDVMNQIAVLQTKVNEQTAKWNEISTDLHANS
jgi:hypothetical protein